MDVKRSQSHSAAYSSLPTPEEESKAPSIVLLLRLCLIGFFVNCQPSEAFLTRYLEEVKGLDERTLDNYVWPYDTFGSFLFYIPTGILAEQYGYAYTIFLGLLFRELTRVILIFCEGTTWMAIMQMTYAGATTVNSVYFAYSFLVLGPQYFKVGTALMMAFYHGGNVLGSIIGQLLVDYTDLGLTWLFYISWSFTSIGLLCFFLLPSVRFDPPENIFQFIQDHSFKDSLSEMSSLYNSFHVRIWTLWWIFSYSSSNIISNYYQNQFYAIDPNGKFGYVEAFMEFTFCVMAFLPSICSFENHQVSFLICSSIISAFLYVASVLFQSSIYFSYLFNTLALGIYHFQYSLAYAVIAKNLESPRYNFIFPFNSFLGLGLSTILQQILGHIGVTTDTYYIAGSILHCISAITIGLFWFRSKLSTQHHHAIN